MNAFDQTVIDQQLERATQGAERYAVIGGQGLFGRNRHARGPFTPEDVLAQGVGQGCIAAPPRFGHQPLGSHGVDTSGHGLLGHDIYSSRGL